VKRNQSAIGKVSDAWIQIEVCADKSRWDVISNRLFEMGAEGVEERVNSLVASFPQRKWEEGKSAWEQYLKDTATDLGEISYRLVEIPSEDWKNKWKEFYKPGPIGERFFLIPIWKKGLLIPDSRIPLWVDPGQAFGTGWHESTQLCIEHLEKILKGPSGTDAIRCVDVGTGTGILSVCAYHLGVRKITAIDVDSEAVSVANENFILNRCEGIDVSDLPIAQLEGSHELVLANILLETHLELLPHYVRLLSKNGDLVLSGLLEEQRKEIGEAIKKNGLQVESEATKGEWLAMRLKFK